MENTKPVVELCHILVNIIDGGTQFFADPGDVELPEDVIWVTLGTTENNWIEVHPVGNDDSLLLKEFLKSGYEVVVSNEHHLMSQVRYDCVTADTIGDCRWFIEKDE